MISPSHEAAKLATLRQVVQMRAGAPSVGRTSAAEALAAGGATRLPARLRAGVEALSGLFMGDVRVHRNSPEPAKLGALAYTRGSDIHLGPGQEKHLPHEAWHVVQQKQGRVRPTTQIEGAGVNTDPGLEAEATRTGAAASRDPGAALAARQRSQATRTALAGFAPPVLQLTRDDGRPGSFAEQKLDRISWSDERRREIFVYGTRADIIIRVAVDALAKIESIDKLSEFQYDRYDQAIKIEVAESGSDALELWQRVLLEGDFERLIKRANVSYVATIGKYEFDTTIDPSIPSIKTSVSTDPFSVELMTGVAFEVNVAFEMEVVPRAPLTEPVGENAPRPDPSPLLALLLIGNMVPQLRIARALLMILSGGSQDHAKPSGAT